MCAAKVEYASLCPNTGYGERSEDVYNFLCSRQVRRQGCPFLPIAAQAAVGKVVERGCAAMLDGHNVIHLERVYAKRLGKPTVLAMEIRSLGYAHAQKDGDFLPAHVLASCICARAFAMTLKSF